MDKITKDNFITKHLGTKSFIGKNIEKEKDLLEINRLKKPFFLTIKNKKKLNKAYRKKLNAKLVCKLINFEKISQGKEKSILNCRKVRKKDATEIKKIALEKTSNSRFFNDKKLPSHFRENIRKNWVMNFFSKKRGDEMIVALNKNKKILGFLLLKINKKKLIVDILATRKKSQNLGVATSLINYINNKFMYKKNVTLIAGTQSNNTSAKNFYKKNGFIEMNMIYVYHKHFFT
jgi:ribosomal protein S18 acetylase RimI-like enzyme